MHRLAVLIILVSTGAKTLRADDAARVFRDRVEPILREHCASCHSGDSPKASLNLAGERTQPQLQAEGSQWIRVLEQVEAGSMPPKKEKRLSKEEELTLANWVRGELADLLIGQRKKDGRSKLRRLSRIEYANTVYDIFGIRPPVVRDLPIDGRVDGYDKVSEALPLSSSHALGYLKIADEMLARFPFGPLEEQPGETVRAYAIGSDQSPGHILELDDDWKVSFNTDTTSCPLRRKRTDNGGFTDFPGGYWKPGMYRLRIRVYAYQTNKPLPFGIYVGHTAGLPQLLELREVMEAPPGKPTTLETEIYMRSLFDSDISIHDSIRLIPFGLGVPVPKNSLAKDCKGPGLALQWVDVTSATSPAPGDRLLFADVPPELREAFTSEWMSATNGQFNRKAIEDVARTMFARVGARIYRRDLTEAELASMMASFNARLDTGAPVRNAWRGELAELMTSPDFLCLVEQPGPLDNFALASRLSYFLWNSAPDEELLRVARKGVLTRSWALKEQTERLLKDPRSERFVKDFVDQWLGLWAIDNTTPDKGLYPEYDDLLKMSSVMETQATFRLMLDDNRSVCDLVAPKWALVNQYLAKHYRLPATQGFALREAPLPANTPFGGVLTQAATMKVTANGTLTSPVKRGVWVAERLLGVSIPPPPPNIDSINPDTRGAKTLRKQLALHRSQGSCSICHAKFDPYGFALESFDVMGAYRTKYRVVDRDNKETSKWKYGLPVDSAGVTPDGKNFTDIKQLRKILAQQPDQIAFGVTRHLLTYATGAAANLPDQRAIEQIVAKSKDDGYGLRSLVHGVVQSDLFRRK